ncbi:MAG: hypothetical protein VX641_06305 [Planctomycetota bacterium]|nr:hypothetical protein [Planctomycetota bacterium]
MPLNFVQIASSFVPASLLAVTSALADVESQLSVDPGSNAGLNLTVTFNTAIDSDTQFDSSVVPVSGGGRAIFRPGQEPFTQVEFTDLDFSLGGSDFQYGFFCDSIFGCIETDITLTKVKAILLPPAVTGINPDGSAQFTNSWRLLADYAVSGSLFSESGSLDVTSIIDFGARFSTGGGDAFVNDLALGSLTTELDAGGGIIIQLDAQIDLSQITLSGTYEELPPAACGGGGPCGAVGAPGCADVDCCVAVCKADFYCCDVSWDVSCVNRAVELCGVAPDNDSCVNARPLGLGRFPFTTRNCSTDGPDLIGECATQANGQSFVNDVWFTHTALADNGVLVSTCNHAAFDTRIAIYESCNGALIACSDDAGSCSGGTTIVGFQGVEGETYLIRVGGASGSGAGEIDLAWGTVDQPYASPSVEWTIASGGNGHHYALYALGSLTTFEDAIVAAERFGGYPATLTSPEETEFVRRNMPATQYGGLTAFGLVQTGGDEPAGGWGWITGEPLDWTNWFAGEPNDALGIEDWGVLYPEGTWNDGGNNFGYVLIEFDEDPSVDEVVWAVEDGGNGKTYQSVILEDRVDWLFARAYAENRGGTLVCLDEPGESEWVFTNLTAFASLWTQTFYNGGPWVGLYEREGQWEWLSGELFDGSNWYPGEPNGTGNRGSYLASPNFGGGFTENFADTPQGTLYGTAVYADVFGNPRLKLVADGFAGTWGTWYSLPVDQSLVAFSASFTFSFKNTNGGPGDGFCFLWGDLSDDTGNRPEGGEFGIFGFLQDGEGLSVGINSYAEGGAAGIDGRWGAQPFTLTPMSFESVTYADYETAGRPESMPTVTVDWRSGQGVSVTIAFPFEPAQVVYQNQGINELSGIDPAGWSFGFAARNGAIDMDVLIGEFRIDYEYLPETGGLGGGPRNTLDDTNDLNVRRTLIIEYPAGADPCPADVNGDGSVGGGDLAILLSQWNGPGSCDFNGDGLVGGPDLSVLLGTWGVCTPRP